MSFHSTSDPIATLEAVVVRCGCGDPDSHNGVRGPEGPCPTPRAVDDLGVIARSDAPMPKINKPRWLARER